MLATGFAPGEFLDPMKVFGRDGRELSDEWHDGARAHLGITPRDYRRKVNLFEPPSNQSPADLLVS